MSKILSDVSSKFNMCMFGSNFAINSMRENSLFLEYVSFTNTMIPNYRHEYC